MPSLSSQAKGERRLSDAMINLQNEPDNSTWFYPIIIDITFAMPPDIKYDKSMGTRDKVVVDPMQTFYTRRARYYRFFFEDVLGWRTVLETFFQKNFPLRYGMRILP